MDFNDLARETEDFAWRPFAPQLADGLEPEHIAIEFKCRFDIGNGDADVEQTVDVAIHVYFLCF
ncbi:hypothetical protein D3C86_2225940 [compost metagenome]